jgi:hypothetical protein
MMFAGRARAGAAIVGIATALALAGCAGTPSAVPPESVAAAPSTHPKFRQSGGANITLAEFQNSAFPYHGPIPDPDDPSKLRPFMNVNDDGRIGHKSPGGAVLWEDQTYNDRHVLLAASRDFDPNAPGVMVVFFHGNHATLSRDVIDRQQAPRQLAQSRLNAVLVAPQLAYDARDSSAGNFWRDGGFAEFLDEADAKLANLYPSASRSTFRQMPVVIVAYSGGYLPTAFSLANGGADDRIRGVVLLDALYGEPDKFAQWIESETGRAFFVSAYSASSKSENLAMKERLQRDGVSTQSGLPDRLGPGTVAFIDAGDVSHEDFVNFAWTNDPLSDVLSRVSR